MKTADDLFVKEHLPQLKEDGSKFDRGRLLLVCGSDGMAGACVMAAKAALRAGVGYLTVAIPRSIYAVVTVQVPEAVCLLYNPDDEAASREALEKACAKNDAVLIGCGLGALREKVVPWVFSCCEKPMLIDADAINQMALSGAFPEKSKDVVITPHEGEMGRILKTESAWVKEHREDALKLACEKTQATVLLKGAHTLIGKSGEESFQNPHVNPGLSRAGSGDTLSGIIASLMAQGMSGFTAAAAGAFLHGEAAEEAKKRFGIRSMLPTDVGECLCEVLKRIE